MPHRVTVYDLKGPNGTVVASSDFTVVAREKVNNQPDRYTFKKPDGAKLVARNPSVSMPDEALSDEDREAAEQRSRENAMGAAIQPIETLQTGPIGGAGSIKGGRDVTRSTGMEVTTFESGEARLAMENPEEAEVAAAEGRPIQPLQTAAAPAEEPPRRRRKKSDDDDA